MNDNNLITTIDLLRHGECKGGEIFRGSTNVKLSDEGWENMRRISASQANLIKWDQIISSPLLRCRLFSEELSAQYSIPLLFKEDFREMDYGEWEGKEFKKIWAKEKSKVESIFTQPDTFQPPGGEHMLDFSSRVNAALESVLNSHRGQHLLLVQHGGTIRVALTYLLSLPLSSMVRFHVPYACFSRIEIKHGESSDQTHLVFHNLQQ